PPLPVLHGITTAPVFTADGALHTEPGYHPGSKLFYAATPGLVIPPVEANPSQEARERAKALILEDLLGEVCFVGGRDLSGKMLDCPERAHAVALLLHRFVRPMIDGRTPLHLIEKPAPGTGAGLLADVLAYPALGHWPAKMAEGGNEDEWRK